MDEITLYAPDDFLPTSDALPAPASGFSEEDWWDVAEMEEDTARANPVTVGALALSGVVVVGALGFYARRAAQRRQLLKYLQADPIQGMLSMTELRESVNEALPIFGMNSVDEAFEAITGRQRGWDNTIRQIPGVAAGIDAAQAAAQGVRDAARDTANRGNDAVTRARSWLPWGDSYGGVGDALAMTKGTSVVGAAMVISAMALMYHRSNSIWKTAAMGLPLAAPVYLTYRGIQYITDRKAQTSE